MSILLNGHTRVLVQGATGRQARRHVPFMLAYGTNVVGGVAPRHGGETLNGFPLLESVRDALCNVSPIDVSVVFVPAAQAVEAALDAVDNAIPTTVVLAEGVAFRDSLRLTERASRVGVRVIGPNCQGIITPGQAKVGASGGRAPERMFAPGRVGVVSRSGGMGAETCWLLTRAGIGQSTYIAIGGELVTGTTFSDIALLFEDDPQTDVIVCFGEPGTGQEEDLARLVGEGRVTKPVIVYVAGSFVESQGTGRSYGHAGAVIGEKLGAPSEKRRLLRENRVQVADSWSDITHLVRAALGDKAAAPMKSCHGNIQDHSA